MLSKDLFQDIPGVLSVAEPKGLRLPLVYDSPHSGVVIPTDFHPAVGPEMVLLASDTWVDELFAAAPETGAALLRAEFPRSFLDVNRAEDDVDLAMVEPGWPHAVRGSAAAQRGMGLAWRYAWGDDLMHDRLLSVGEMQARIDTYWHPYHDRLRALLDATWRDFGRVYHINCHSMPAFGHVLSPDPAGTRRADFVIGDFDGTTAEPEFVALLQETLIGMGYEVALNKPFRGAELITRYSDPARGRFSLQIEVNRRLYMDEDSRAKTSGFAGLQADLSQLALVTRDYVAALPAVERPTT